MKKQKKNIVIIVSIIMSVLLLIIIYNFREKYIINKEFRALENKLAEIGKEEYKKYTSADEGKYMIRADDFIKKGKLDELKLDSTNTYCNVENSYAQLIVNNKEFKYSAYLDCGKLKSKIDEEAPVITLNGDLEINLEIGSEWIDPGVKKITDNKDKISNDNIKILGTVNTKEIGTYYISYIARDKNFNSTIIVRAVNVSEKISNELKRKLGSDKYFLGIKSSNTNYIRIGGYLYRVVSLNEDGSIKVVSADNVAVLPYSKSTEYIDSYIDKWLNDKYLKTIPNYENIIVLNSKWCDYKVESINETINCSTEKTFERPIVLPAFNDFLETGGVANSTVSSYIGSLTRTFLNSNDKIVTNIGEHLYETTVSFPMGIRPMFNIKDALYYSGDGSYDRPYILEYSKSPRSGEKIASRYIGEYVNFSGLTWRISNIDSKGVELTMEGFISDNKNIYYQKLYGSVDGISYQKNAKNNIGYYLENDFINKLSLSYMIKHDQNELYYDFEKNEISHNKKINEVYVSLPNLGDLFVSDDERNGMRQYIYLATVNPNDKYGNYYISTNNVAMGTLLENELDIAIKPKIVINKDLIVFAGRGTEEYPYEVK